MLTFRINVTRNIMVPEFLRPGQLRLVGENVAVPTMKARMAQGLDVTDAPAKPLSAPYIKAKTRAGRPGVPDLTYSGAMLADLGVLSVENMRMLIGFHSQLSIIKAIRNQARRRQIGLSPKDQAAVEAALREIVGMNMAESRRMVYRAA